MNWFVLDNVLWNNSQKIRFKLETLAKEETSYQSRVTTTVTGNNFTTTFV